MHALWANPVAPTFATPFPEGSSQGTRSARTARRVDPRGIGWALPSVILCHLLSSAPAQEFRITAITNTLSGVSLSYPSATNSYYILERGVEVTSFAPLWVALGQAGEGVFLDATPTNAAAYYRIRQVPQNQAGDLDGDGVNDADEIRQGRDPLKADWPNQPPAVRLAIPAAGTIFTAGDTIEVSAEAGDPDGQVVRVLFFAGNLQFGDSVSPPFRAAWSGVPAGAYALRAQVFDDRGASVKSEFVNITVNPTNFPPRVRIAEPVANMAYGTPASLVVRANAQDPDGSVVRVEFFAGTRSLGVATSAPFEVLWDNIPAGEHVLTAWATDNAGVVGTSFGVPIRITEPDVTPPLTFTSSPAHRESGVAVTRETVLRFTYPLAADTLLGPNNLYALHGGRRILSRAELSTDRQTLTLFYLENLPASSRIRVRLDGSGLRDFLGRELDLDGDGRPGGYADIDFDTVSITPIAGTAISGRVFRSDTPEGELNPTNVVETPLPGVQIEVIGAEENLRTKTDAMGNFTLEPCPVGRFFVRIDGRTATNGLPNAHLPWAERDYYPVIEKAWEAKPGRTNFAAQTGTIYLPLIRKGTLQVVSATEDTIISFPPDVVARNPELAGVTITVPPNVLLSANGTRGGRMGMAPVSPNRLPEPLPLGLTHIVDISIQTDGPNNFTQPIGARFPNLPDPATGRRLNPGEKSALWSYDHDSGEWVVVGPMMVSPDGAFLETDLGVGIRQPGWHGAQQGTQGGGKGGQCGGSICCGGSSGTPFTVEQCKAPCLPCSGLTMAHPGCWDCFQYHKLCEQCVSSPDGAVAAPSSSENRVSALRLNTESDLAELFDAALPYFKHAYEILEQAL
ncbi:MAG: Ig-like domain-containing protein [Limisphaerales bacterium]